MEMVARQQAPRQGRLLMCPISLQALWVSIHLFFAEEGLCPVGVYKWKLQGTESHLYLHTVINHRKWCERRKKKKIMPVKIIVKIIF